MTEPYTPAPADPPLPVDEPASGLDRARELLADRRALALVAAAGVAVVALAAFVIVPAVSGGSSSPAALPVVPHHFPNPVAGSTATPTPAPTVTDTAVLKIRDPFVPLYTPIAAAPAAATSAPPPSSAPPVQVIVAPPTNAPAAPSSSSPARTRIDFALVTIHPNNTADVTINATPYNNVPLNQTFAQSFKMVAINGHSAEFYYGDQPFALSPGQHFYFF